MEAKKKKQPVYTEQYKSQAVEMVIHSGKSVARSDNIGHFRTTLCENNGLAEIPRDLYVSRYVVDAAGLNLSLFPFS